MNGFLLGAWIACQTLDGSSSAANLARPSHIEANPLMAGKGLTIRLSVNIWGLWATRKASSTQRNITAASFALSGCIAGGWNLHQLTK